MSPLLWIAGMALLIGALGLTHFAGGLTDPIDSGSADSAIRWAMVLAMAGALCWRFA